MPIKFLIILILATSSYAAPSNKKDGSCTKEKLPSAKDVEKFLDLDPPVRDNSAYQSKGLFQGDMFGLDSKYDNKNRQIIMPEGLDADKLRWPNKQIPYAFYERIDRKSMQVVLNAMADMQEKTCIRFVPLTNQEDYLKISPGKSCASPVGYRKGEHVVSVNTGCMDDLGALQHELMHALGLFHEQSRPDRDQYVFINFDNIMSDATSKAQFFILKDGSLVDLGIPYDYASVMHYTMNSFAKDKNSPTIIPNENGKSEIIGQRVELSPYDIKRINKLYRCDDNPLDEVKQLIPKVVQKKYEDTYKQWQHLCDGHPQTPEAWDQQPDTCMKMCRKLDNKTLGPDGLNLFNVDSTKQCLWKAQLCDGVKDSQSSPDAQPEICKKYCARGGYVTLPGTLQCIHFSKLCDGKVDATKEIDEEKSVCQQLSQSPTSGFFGELFSSDKEGMRVQKKTWLCDGKHGAPLDDPEYCMQHCKDGGYVTVGESKQCIHWRKLRDGHVDTESGDDEDPEIAEATCKKYSEGGGETFSLPKTKQCVSKQWLCDGTQRDQEDLLQDPEFCHEKCTESGYIFAEDSDQCFSMLQLCDGKQDTRTGWDEDPESCQKACKPTAGFPPAGQTLHLDPKTKECKLVGTPKNPSAKRKCIIKKGKKKAAKKVLAPTTNESEGDARRKKRSVEPFTSPSSLSFILGHSKPVPDRKSANVFELRISNSTHELLRCEKPHVITTISADYIVPKNSECKKLSWKEIVSRKCDQLPICGFIARDPSEEDGCMARTLLVRYSCAAPIETFRTDPSADGLCSINNKKPVDTSVQCNLSAETLIP